ncbi:NifU family protein [Nocardioides sp.]|uniref:NifU family protein n=1 Tax=Nocardioides sp. TaxID=35761 RepID=UPI003783301C
MTTLRTTPAESSLEDLAAALDAAGEAEDPRVAALDELHRRALTIVVRRLRDDPRGKELLFELVDEPEVHMVLAMHGIVRPDPTTLTRRVLDGVRPGLQSHGGDVELDRIENGIAFVRLQGACNGCSMAAVTMREGVERALLGGVPGLRGVEVVPNDPGPTLITLPLMTRGEIGPGPGWVRVLSVDAVPAGELRAVTVPAPDGRPVEAVVVNAADRLTAYVNRCAHQALRLDDALVDASQGTLTCPWHGFCYDTTNGECLTLAGAQLEQLPLTVSGGHVWLRPEPGTA